MTHLCGIRNKRKLGDHSPFRIPHSAFRGFSLIEVVLAIGILAIGLFGAIRVFPVGLKASQRSEWLSRATLMAEQVLEPLKLKSWDELEQGQTTSMQDPFNVVVSIDQPQVEGLLDPARLKRVGVTISWMQEGRLRSITMVSYVQQQSS